MELVFDVAMDYYGRRLATAGSDQKIKVWMQSSDGTWVRQAEWTAHHGPIWRVTFAHPEHGQIIASCSFDHNVLIWEEQEGVDDKGRVVSRWHQRAQLSDARDSVNEIKFAPRHMGLKIAAGSADGHVRVYESTDATSLAHWEFSDEFEAESPAKGGVSCLAWTTSPFDTAMMVVGGGSGMAKVWGYSPAARRWLPMLDLLGHVGRVQDVAWAPVMGRSYHLIATSDAEGGVAVWRLQPEATAEYASSAGSGASSSSGSGSGSGSDGSRGRAWGVRRLPGSSADASVAAAFTDHVAAPAPGAAAAPVGVPVWRVEWNVTGTVLASSGDDGKLRLRRQAAGALAGPGGHGAWETTAELLMSGPAGAGAGAAVGAGDSSAAGAHDAAASAAAPAFSAPVAVAAAVAPIAAAGFPGFPGMPGMPGMGMPAASPFGAGAGAGASPFGVAPGGALPFALPGQGAGAGPFGGVAAAGPGRSAATFATAAATGGFPGFPAAPGFGGFGAPAPAPAGFGFPWGGSA